MNPISAVGARRKRALGGRRPVPPYLHERCAQPKDAYGQQVLLEPHLHRIVTWLEEKQAWPGQRPPGGQGGRRSTPRPWAHRLPPGTRRVQPTALAELQATGVGHAGRVVNLEPVGVVGNAAAAELRKSRLRGAGPRLPHPHPPHSALPRPHLPLLTSVWMMLQALVRPTLPGVPYRCSPFFRSCCAYLSICRCSGLSRAVRDGLAISVYPS